MAEIVAGVAISHSPLIMSSEERGGEKGQRFLQKSNEMKELAGRGWSRCSCVDFR